MMNVNLLAFDESDRDQFILETQEAFNYGAMEEFGRRDDYFEENENMDLDDQFPDGMFRFEKVMK